MSVLVDHAEDDEDKEEESNHSDADGTNGDDFTLPLAMEMVQSYLFNIIRRAGVAVAAVAKLITCLHSE